MKRKSGFSFVGLILIICIVFVIGTTLLSLILYAINGSKKTLLKNMAYGMVEAAELNYLQDSLTEISSEVIITYVNEVETANPREKALNYKGGNPENGYIVINVDGEVAIAIHDGKYCAEKGFRDGIVSINKKTLKECVIIGY